MTDVSGRTDGRGSAVVGTVRFARAGHTPWRLVAPLCAGAVPAAFVGGSVALSARVYEPLLAILLIGAALRLWSPGATSAVRVCPADAALVAVGSVLGLAAGLTGIGGGVFLSPLLILIGWADPRGAAGASAPFILLNSIAGLAGQVSAAQHVLHQAVVLAGVALVGATVRLVARRFEPVALRRVLAVVLALASAKLLATSF